MQSANAAKEEAHKKADAMLHAAGRLEKVVQIVSSASTQLAAQIEQSDKGAAQAAQRLAEAATAMNQMNATVQEVARNAGQASVASAETREKAQSGATIVQKSLVSIGQVQSVSQELKQDMLQLNAHAQAINQIMGVISDIADQTNLLALNAAIEAARAGESGRGFAVVADEVRALASKTQQSTGDIQTHIAALQRGAQEAVAAIAQAGAQGSEGLQVLRDSARLQQSVQQSVDEVHGAINAATQAAAHQADGAGAVRGRVEIIHAEAQRAAEAVAAIAGNARALDELAAQLKASLGQFKV